METLSVIVSGLAMAVTLAGVILANRRAQDANNQSVNAMKISQSANELAQSANVYASEANSISKQNLSIAETTFANQYVPKITFRYGASGELSTSPPIQCFMICVANEGFLPVRVEHLGLHVVGSQFTAPLFSYELIHDPLNVPVPMDLIPGRVLRYRVPFELLKNQLALSTSSTDDTFTIRVFQQTGQYFEGEPLNAGDYLGDELPTRVTFEGFASDSDTTVVSWYGRRSLPPVTFGVRKNGCDCFPWCQLQLFRRRWSW